MITDSIAVVDVDTHVIEPPDLWTSRLPKKYADVAPQLEWDEAMQLNRWHVGPHLIAGVAAHSHAGWKDFYPSTPPTLEEADPGGWDSHERLKSMDRHGVDVQIIYPNLLGFMGFAFLDIPDAQLRLECVRSTTTFRPSGAAPTPGD